MEQPHPTPTETPTETPTAPETPTETPATTGTEIVAHDQNLVCPECGYVAGSPAGLGTHRARRHGVTGASKAAKRARRAAANAKRTPTPDPEALDRSLLRALYPDGQMPVTAMPRIRAWLDEAHRLTK